MKKETQAAKNWIYIGEDEEPAFKWDELPRDVFASILSRLGPGELLTRVQYVSRLWRNVCNDPLMWRRIYIGHRDAVVYEYNYLHGRCAYINPKDDDDESLRRRIHSRIVNWLHQFQTTLRNWLDRLCRLAVDRSLGSLESITINDFATDDLLHYVADRSRRLKHLRLILCDRDTLTKEGMISVADKVPFLEELEFFGCNIAEEVIEAFARSCPLLVSFKFEPLSSRTSLAGRVIAHQMPCLVHLNLVGDLTNDELEAILDGCPRLESLNLYRCRGIDLDGELGLRCRERINKFWSPYDPLDDDSDW